MEKLFLGFLMLLLLGFGYVEDGTNLEGKLSGESEMLRDEDGNGLEEQEAVWNYSGISEPKEMTYIQGYEICSIYETDDPNVIRDCVQALKAMRIEGKTDLCATDFSDILHFVMEDGSTYAVTFEAGILVRDGKRYTVTGFSKISDILKELSEDISGN